MTLLAIVTFDLHHATPESYIKVKRRLSKLKLENQITPKKSEVPTRLPANTFAAKFSGDDDKASDLRNDLKKRVKKLIKNEGLKASIFVAVGDSWAWGKGRV